VPSGLRFCKRLDYDFGRAINGEFSQDYAGFADMMIFREELATHRLGVCAEDCRVLRDDGHFLDEGMAARVIGSPPIARDSRGGEYAPALRHLCLREREGGRRPTRHVMRPRGYRLMRLAVEFITTLEISRQALTMRSITHHESFHFAAMLGYITVARGSPRSRRLVSLSPRVVSLLRW